MAMKLFLLFTVVHHAGAAVDAKQKLAHGGELKTGTSVDTAAVVVDQEAVTTCIAEAKDFLVKPMKKGMAIERAVDSCALDKRLDDRNYVCPHYHELLTNAFARESTTKEYTAASFCKVTETYTMQMQTAPYVPNVGTGSGFSFELSQKCEPTVAKAIAPAEALAGPSVPDFWYAMCMSQDCAHFLPSRTRWCDVNRAPTHSAAVCEGIRTFAKDEVTIVSAKEMEPTDICKIYSEFVEETLINLEAYMHVIHHSHKNNVPTPEDAQRALRSSQLVNNAGKNYLKDNNGDYVKPNHSSAVLLHLHTLIGSVIFAVFLA
mmetsp:Transcript_96694/g.167825  ORF Transcript_96694/g.167825 Transcript_96694/m.167825 type:complete len:318 (+) Transcript_96694:88-1041(+)